MEKLKEEIRLKIIHPFTHPEIYKAYGKTIGGGILAQVRTNTSLS